jgi:hypothetical protein
MVVELVKNVEALQYIADIFLVGMHVCASSLMQLTATASDRVKLILMESQQPIMFNIWIFQ